ncbi:MAG: hypothetical protein ACKVG1_13735, partial [Rhodospirillales bacterium]
CAGAGVVCNNKPLAILEISQLENACSDLEVQFKRYFVLSLIYRHIKFIAYNLGLIIILI